MWICAGVEMCRCGCEKVHVSSSSHLNGRLVGRVDHPKRVERAVDQSDHVALQQQ